jgi:type III pantothenate kinase
MSSAVLVMDAGNTRIKWGLHDGAGWSASGAVATSEAHALPAALADLPMAPSRLLASNVAGPAARAAIETAARSLGIAAVFLRPAERCCGVRNGYRDPARLGADRWAALVGARARTGAACVVANAGTAITVDALDRDGLFIGGLILPGVELMLRSLAGGTADLHDERGAFAEFPVTTADAMTSGALCAAAGAVRAMIEHLQRRDGEAPALLLTGGGAAAIEPRLPGGALLVPRLVLEGLVRIVTLEYAP